MKAWFRHLIVSVALLTIALLTLLGFACSNGRSAENAGSPEEVARHALQALFDGDSQAFLEEVRPDRREPSESLALRVKGLRGCQIDDEKTVVDGSETSALVSFVFQESCGQALGVLYANKGCSVRLEKLTAGGSTGWFLPYADVQCAADLDTRDRFP